MPRLLNDEPCEITFFDRLSRSKITLHYRMPTTEERVKYQNGMFTKKGNKVESTASEPRIKYGSAILLGFKEGSFAKAEGRPLSSDPASPHYDPEWKGFIRKYAPDVIELLAITVFEASLAGDTPDDASDDKATPDENPT
jgi:hypothetical protein